MLLWINGSRAENCGLESLKFSSHWKKVCETATETFVYFIVIKGQEFVLLTPGFLSCYITINTIHLYFLVLLLSGDNFFFFNLCSDAGRVSNDL